MTRLDQMINLYRNEVAKINQSQIGQHQLILIEGVSFLTIPLHRIILET